MADDGRDPPRIALTMGEPAGIGPDLCALVAAGDWPARITIFGDAEVLRERAGAIGVSLQTLSVDRADADVPAGTVAVVHCPVAAPVSPGTLDPGNASAVLKTLELAGMGCLDGTFDAVVTAPVQKSVINDAGLPFTGHTEFFAALTRAPLPVMLLTAGSLRVALVTTHLPLREVADAVTATRLAAVLEILHGELRTRMGIAAPRILVCGLNPHAGEGGHLGREELDVIIPCLERLRRSGLNLVGPLPADTLFTPRVLDGADAVLAMYHDQGLPVLKHVGFGHAVNITLGLPIIRTSVDHGTALDLAATGKADPGSLKAALDAAIHLVNTARRETAD